MALCLHSFFLSFCLCVFVCLFILLLFCFLFLVYAKFFIYLFFSRGELFCLCYLLFIIERCSGFLWVFFSSPFITLHFFVLSFVSECFFFLINMYITTNICVSFSPSIIRMSSVFLLTLLLQSFHRQSYQFSIYLFHPWNHFVLQTLVLFYSLICFRFLYWYGCSTPFYICFTRRMVTGVCIAL